MVLSITIMRRVFNKSTLKRYKRMKKRNYANTERKRERKDMENFSN